MKETKYQNPEIIRFSCEADDHSTTETTSSLWIWFRKEDIRYAELKDLNTYCVVQNKKYIHLLGRPKNLSLNEFKKYFILD